MKTKLYILLTFGLFVLSTPVQAGCFRVINSSNQNASKIIKIEKIKRYNLFKPLFFADLQHGTKNALRASVRYIENLRLADFYRDQPVLYGIITLFAVVLLGVFSCIFYWIRNDPRFL
jgi:hypothetical protein